MCRIFGSVGPGARREELDAMEKLLEPGGPDHYGVYLDESAALGHRRLSIIDLSEGANQPMRHGDLVMSYNGEVYNYRELRRELEGEYRFETDSDSEVVLKAFHKWGKAAIGRFRGMFAIAFWERRRRRLTLVRDRAGVKPLYYVHDGERLIFASEIKAILRHGAFVPRIDARATALYFQLGFVPAPLSIFEGCRKLESGTILEFEGGETKLERYWDPLDFARMPRLEGSEEELEERLESLLMESFRYRMIADVEVGLFLSGGVDSTLLASMLSREFRLKTFTIGFEEERYDEAETARRVARRLGTEHTEHRFGMGDLLELIPETARIFDEPFADSSALPTLLVSRLAAQKVKVVLSADGADELFWGYPSNFRNAARYRRRAPWSFLRPLLAPFGHYKIRKTAALMERDPFRYKLATRYRFFPEEFRHPYRLEPSFDCGEMEYEECAFLFDFRYFLGDDVLVKVDRSTMAHSLEAREPFLDHRLAEFALRLPPRFKYREGRTKYLLRRLLERHLDPGIASLPKKGFEPPLRSWLRGALKEQVLEAVHGYSYLDELFDKSRIVDEFYRHGRRTKEIWMIYVYHLWYERYGKGTG